MKFLVGLLLVCLVALAGCAQLPAFFETPTPATPTTVWSAEAVPDAAPAARAYLDAWKVEDYPAMYNMLTSLSRSAIALEDFIQHYRSVAVEANLTTIDYEILSVLVNPDTAQARYRVHLNSALVGEIVRETLMDLRLEKDEWRVQWNDTLILPELVPGNYLLMDRSSYVPSRANIYDIHGKALVAQTDATALGLYVDQVNPTQVEALFAQLADLTGKRVDTMMEMYRNTPRGAGWYLPFGEVSSEVLENRLDLLTGFSGLEMRPYKARYYFESGIAPHVLGYVGVIQPDEVEYYQRLGYRQDERVGRSGLEKWGETYLAGKRGGALYVFNAQGRPVTLLAETPAQPSYDLYTTLDRDLQAGAQLAMTGFRGALVVLERDSGRVLAMVSSPGFDPNAFEPINYNSSSLLAEILNDPQRPLLNRATQGQYPLGSVFKIVTMAAGLYSGRYTSESTYQCGYLFEELPGVQLHDWTYDYFLRDGRTIPSGLLTLPEGLMRSCNPWFWHIGLSLYNQGMETTLSSMARSFGLGQPTGIEGVEELPGQMPDPENVIDAVNMAIGQGPVLVTPLQVARFAAAIGNGGILYQPQIIERIDGPGGQPLRQFEPRSMGELPLSAADLQSIQQAMVGVIRNERPRGTAWHRFTGLDIAVAGKTGTAQSGREQPHAWFAGYTLQGREDKPDIAIAVVLEYAGEGSDYAAPIFRRIVELYFIGQPQKLYWWETAFNVPFTPTPQVTPTPVIELTPTLTP